MVTDSTPHRRKSTGKRLRFAVLTRDQFTCRYCGMRPPDVVLVVDHITPVAAGGETSIDNLVTACEACNQGKGATVITDAATRTLPISIATHIQTEDGQMFFHTFVGSTVEWQGRLIRYVDRDGTTFAEVELYSWVDGGLNGSAFVECDSGDRQWRFYPTAKAMRWAYYAEMNRMSPAEIAFAERMQQAMMEQ